jgi:hypothetical protein
MPWPSCSRTFRHRLKSRLAAIGRWPALASPERAHIVASQVVEDRARS